MTLLKLPAEDAAGNVEAVDLMQTALATMDEMDLAFYGRMRNGNSGEEVFVARSPQKALEWICKRVSRPTLTHIVQHIYDHPTLDLDQNIGREVLDSDADDSNAPIMGSLGECTSEQATVAGQKRKRTDQEKTKRQVKRTLAQNMDMAFTVANSQDLKQAKTARGTLVDETVYREFVTRLPGIGVHTAARMMAMAMAVGTTDVFEDWHSILTVWKRQEMYGKRLNQRVAMTLDKPAPGQELISQHSVLVRETQDTMSSQHPVWEQIDEAGLTLSETESFRRKFLDAQKTQVDGMADYMRHRWKMDILYEEFARLEYEIRRRKQGTGARGRRYNTVAKEHLFVTTYAMDLKRRPTKEMDGQLWHTFGKFLDWGKRWSELKRRFGTLGIFGLLPASSNNFVEKFMSQAQVTQWIEMLDSCNKDIRPLAVYMEPLFLACMEESEPPAEFSFLERLETLEGRNVLQHFAGTQALTVGSPSAVGSSLGERVSEEEDST